MPSLLQRVLAATLALLHTGDRHLVAASDVCEASLIEVQSHSLLQRGHVSRLPVLGINEGNEVGPERKRFQEKAIESLDDIGFTFESANPSSAEVAAVNTSWWTPLAQPADPKGKPKLAVLMMTGDSVVHTQLWEAWLEDGRRSDLPVSLLVHAQFGNLSNAPRQAVLAPNVIPTSWCDIYDAEMYMLGQALLDPDVTHMAIVSGDSVPLQRLATIYDKLERDASSRLCFDASYVIIRAETWMLLRRSDAELFWQWRGKAAEVFKLGCTEENGWLYPLYVRSFAGTGHRPLNECIMFTDWSDTHRVWGQIAAGMNLTALRSQPHKADSECRCHPRTYFHINAASWAELQGTPFWFGRKFATNAFADLLQPFGV